jgi:hypothetical protein
MRLFSLSGLGIALHSFSVQNSPQSSSSIFQTVSGLNSYTLHGLHGSILERVESKCRDRQWDCNSKSCLRRSKGS